MSPGVNIDFCTFRFGDFSFHVFGFFDPDFANFLRGGPTLLDFLRSEFRSASDFIDFLRSSPIFTDFLSSEIRLVPEFVPIFLRFSLAVPKFWTFKGIIVFGPATTLLGFRDFNEASDHSSAATHPKFSTFNGTSGHPTLRESSEAFALEETTHFRLLVRCTVSDPLRNSVLVAQLGKGTRRKFWVPPPRSRNRSFCFVCFEGVEVLSRILRMLLSILENSDL
jgi:hypothetical protein